MRTALTTLKIAVLAPIPRAGARTATKVRPRVRKSIRRPKRTSWRMWSMVGSPDRGRFGTLDGGQSQPSGNQETQLDLFLAYAKEPKAYPAFQAHFRKSPTAAA